MWKLLFIQIYLLFFLLPVNIYLFMFKAVLGNLKCFYIDFSVDISKYSKLLGLQRLLNGICEVKNV